jgi:hypothetical protein
MKMKLENLGIVDEDWAVITINHFEHKLVGAELTYVSPLILTSRMKNIFFAPNGSIGNFFVASSDTIHPYNGNVNESSLVEYTYRYLNSIRIQRHISNFDFEAVINEDKSLHQNLRIVFGTHKDIYIHNEGLFLDIKGLLFSNEFIGNNVIKKLFKDEFSKPVTPIKVQFKKRTVNYFIKRRDWKLLKNRIYFKMNSVFNTMSNEKFVITEFSDLQLKLYSLETELTTTIFLYELISKYKAYWTNKLHEPKSI